MPDIQIIQVTSWAEALKTIKNEEIARNGYFLPIIFKGIDLGPCTSTWSSLAHLKSKITNKQVVIHKSSKNEALNFSNKNFSYEKCDFDQFLEQLEPTVDFNKVVYLRSTSKKFRKDAANIEADFPEISDEVNICPETLESDENSKTTVTLKTFSTILRISSWNTQIWNHYDTLDNFLMQVVGHKSVFLSPPLAANSLGLQLGSDKPDIFDPWSAERSRNVIAQDNIYKAILKPGDVLFLPSHWFHATKVCQDPEQSLDADTKDFKYQFSISVNHFWKNRLDFKNEFYDKKDLYGNRAPKPAQEIERLSQEIGNLLEKLPSGDVRQFYKSRCLEWVKSAEN